MSSLLMRMMGNISEEARMKHLMTLGALLLLTSCTSHIVRDTVVYEAELDQYDAWATKQAALIRGFMAESCVCDREGIFTTKDCRDAADFVLTIEARAAWHKQMSLYLAGISEKRPSKTPPEIPASRTLCPEPVFGGE